MERQLNPIVKARVAKGLSVTELAILAGVDYALVHQHETGRMARPSPAILRALEQLGFDHAYVSAAYSEWRRAKAREVLVSKGLVKGEGS